MADFIRCSSSCLVASSFSAIKVCRAWKRWVGTGTEMATEIVDHAMQAFGAMGVAKELPLQLMAQKVRTMRVYEGPSEVHRMAIARRIIGK